jgi:hypothetical protein
MVDNMVEASRPRGRVDVQVGTENRLRLVCRQRRNAQGLDYGARKVEDGLNELRT